MKVRRRLELSFGDVVTLEYMPSVEMTDGVSYKPQGLFRGHAKGMKKSGESQTLNLIQRYI